MGVEHRREAETPRFLVRLERVSVITVYLVLIVYESVRLIAKDGRLPCPLPRLGQFCSALPQPW